MAKQEFKRLKKDYHGRKKGSAFAIRDIKVAQKLHNQRSLRAQAIDNALKAKKAGSLDDWRGQMNRRDIVDVDFFLLKKASERKMVKEAKKPKKKMLKPFREPKIKKAKGNPSEFVSKMIPIEKATANAALFYTYYYLSEFAKIPETDKLMAQWEFKKLSQELEDGFANYGLYACLRELRHLKGQSDAPPISEWITFQDAMRKQHKLNKAEVSLAWKLMNNKAITVHSTRSGYREFLTHIQNRNGVNLIPSKKLFAAIEGLFNKLSWHSAYGGKKWATIARTLKQKWSVPRTVWVDMMWSLQHNTGTWVNKVASDSSMEYTMIQKLKRSGKTVLMDVLENKLAGKMQQVGKVAALFNPKLNKYLPHLPSAAEKPKVRGRNVKRRKRRRN